MKTTVSIPDPLFKWAEEYASEHKLSRSEVYARGLEALQGEETTRKLNEVLAGLDTTLDPVIAEMQFRSIEPEIWEEAPKRKTKVLGKALMRKEKITRAKR